MGAVDKRLAIFYRSILISHLTAFVFYECVSLTAVLVFLRYFDSVHSTVLHLRVVATATLGIELFLSLPWKLRMIGFPFAVSSSQSSGGARSS